MHGFGQRQALRVIVEDEESMGRREGFVPSGTALL